MAFTATQYNPQFNSFFTGLFTNKNYSPGLALLGRGYARPLQLLEILNPGGSFPCTDPNGILNTAYQPREVVVAQIATATQSGSNLILTFTDPNFSAFRQKFIVRDKANVQAYVVSPTATNVGTITIAPGPYNTTLTAGTHFPVGSFVLQMGSGSGNHNSSGVANLYQVPGVRQNYSAIARESCQFSSREKFNIVDVTGEGNVQDVMGFTDGEAYMVDRFMNSMLIDAIFSDPGQANGIEGQYNRFQGLRAAIRDQGGRFAPMTSLFTQSDFESDLDWMASNDPTMLQNFMVICGREAWKRISSFYTQTVTFFSDTREISPGQNMNFDLKTATIGGVTAKFMVWGIFDDKEQFPDLSTVTGAQYMMSNTYAMLNLSPIPNKLGGVVPVIRKFHFAMSEVTGGAELLYRYVPGMIGTGVGSSTGLPTLGGYQAATSDIMGASFQIARDGGFDCAGDACVWRELIA